MTPSDAVVYVVDDDSSVRDALKFLIESVDLRVAACAGAQEFLEAYDPRKPGCLVLDVRMPGLDGLGVQGELAARNIPWPVIVITGYADATTERRVRAAGAHAFLKKPFDDEILLDLVARAIESERARPGAP